MPLTVRLFVYGKHYVSTLLHMYIFAGTVLLQKWVRMIVIKKMEMFV